MEEKVAKSVCHLSFKAFDGVRVGFALLAADANVGDEAADEGLTLWTVVVRIWINNRPTIGTDQKIHGFTLQQIKAEEFIPKSIRSESPAECNYYRYQLWLREGFKRSRMLALFPVASSWLVFV